MSEKKRAFIVINSIIYSYHNALANVLIEILADWDYDTLIIDISSGKNDFEYYNDIVKNNPDFMITLDMSGYRFSSELETPSFNNIPCIFLNLIIDSLLNLEHYFDNPLNFSMFFYSGDKENIQSLQYKYPEIPNFYYEQNLKKEYVTDKLKLVDLVDKHMKAIESILHNTRYSE